MFFIMLFSAAILDAAQGSLEVPTRTASSLVNIAFGRVAPGIQTIAELRALQWMLEPDFNQNELLRDTLGNERFGAIRAIANTLRPLGQAIRDSVVRLILEISDLNRLPAEALQQRFSGLSLRDTDIVSRLEKFEIERLYYLKTGQFLRPKPGDFKFEYSLAEIAAAGREIAQHFVGDLYRVVISPKQERSHASINSVEGLEEILSVVGIVPEDIQQLSLFNNRITKLPNGVFRRFHKLQELDLGVNQIDELRAGIFAGLSDLQKLILSNNRIAALPPGIFAGLRHLHELWLSYNLRTMSDQFPDAPELWKMRRQYPQLFTEPQQIMGLEVLSTRKRMSEGAEESARKHYRNG